jgi:hypothetical protein
MAEEHRVRVSGGKYTFVQKSYWVEIERYGESWHKQHEASNALTSIMAELDAARVVLAAVRSLEKRGDAPAALVQALRLHEALVDDKEHPSEWAVPSEAK